MLCENRKWVFLPKKKSENQTLECTSFKKKKKPSSNEKLRFTTQYQKKSKK